MRVTEHLPSLTCTTCDSCTNKVPILLFFFSYGKLKKTAVFAKLKKKILFKMNMADSSTCLFCNRDETVVHAFLFLFVVYAKH